MTTTTFYQAVFNGYDKPWKPVGIADGVEYLVIAGVVPKKQGAIRNRYHKLWSPPQSGDYSVYMDGNITPAAPIADINEWVKDQLGDADMAICGHHDRKCAFVELEACLGRKKITTKQAERAHDLLTKFQLPRNFGLWECGIILRRSHVPWVNYVCQRWFTETRASEVHRDQLWLPPILHAAHKAIPAGRFKTLPMNVRKNSVFSFKPHQAP